MGGRRVRLDPARSMPPCPARAGPCSRSATRPGLAELGRGLVERGFELVSTGGTARALREAGLPVTDVAAVTGLPRDARRPGQDAPPAGPRRAPRRPPAGRHREALIAAGIAPFDLVVVNLYPFAAAAERPVVRSTSSSRRSTSAARRWSAPRRRTTPPSRSSRRPRGTTRSSRRSTSRGTSRSACGPRSPSRPSATPPRTTPGSPPSCRAGCDDAGVDLPPSPACPAPRTRTRRCSSAAREGRDAPLRREPAPAGRALPPDRPRAAPDRRAVRDRRAAAPGQGALVQQRPRRVGRRRARPPPARPGVRHRQAHQPVRRRRARRRSSRPGRRPSPATRCPRSAASVALTGRDRRRSPSGWPRSSSRSSSRPSFDAAALEVLATKPNLRLVEDPASMPTARVRTAEVDYLGSSRTAGGAVLVGAPDTLASTTPRSGSRPPRPRRTASGRPRPRLAPRPGRRLERHRPRPRRPADRARLGPGQPRRRLPPGRREGRAQSTADRGDAARCRIGRVLPVRRRPRGPPRRGRHGDRPARRLDARRRGPRCRRRGRRRDAHHRRAATSATGAGAGLRRNRCQRGSALPSGSSIAKNGGPEIRTRRPRPRTRRRPP